MKTRKTNPAAKAAHRILILDDHPMTRDGLSQLLRRETDLMVCGEAGDARQAHATVRAQRPDLVLTDITMPGKGGLEFIREMSDLHPGVRLLVVSMHDETIYAERALQAGARGYIMKSEGGADLLAAIRQVLRGEIYVSKKMSAFLLHQIAGGRSRREGLAISAFTNREFDVFQLIGQGLGTREIGQRLHISGKTVETHRGNLKKKLKLRTGAELLSYALRWSLAKTPT